MGQLNPTRQEILDAHEALDEMFHHILFSGGHCPSKAREQILAALPPIPRPTMDEVEWDDSKHYLAEADHPTWGKVIMLFKKVGTGNIFVNFPEDGEQSFIYCTPENLTPTGRRYVLYVLQEGE
ncbi:hypothetical protein GWO63_010130 [Corynebacterium macginleyi]|uniref:DUF1963 domain-containing protein n=1 Tax=Corynebacterium macginleyi TaxID=38290 RepID=A0ABS1Y882_9CORY|nr:hypothetical protein [Corynebacterium macginleyi]MBM0244585.1 hypothetical protein [Corynebacterium macginleyi]